jgi:hypothetical protein
MNFVRFTAFGASATVRVMRCSMHKRVKNFKTPADGAPREFAC